MKSARALVFLFVFIGSGISLGLSNELDREWFSKGMEPLEVGVLPHDVFALQKSCVSCHGGVHAEWAKSIHGKAWSDPLFQEGFALERKDRCVNCHAPLLEQAKAARMGNASGILATGVNCVACHVRSGKVYSRTEDPDAPHAVIKDATFGSPMYCAGCHDFHTASGAAGKMASAQSTYREWLQYAETKGAKSCVACHSSPLNHLFPVDLSSAGFTRAIEFSAQSRKNGLEFTAKNIGVGHAFPTGDLFREIVLEVKFDVESTFREVQKYSKLYETKGEALRLVRDTRLFPGKSNKVRVPVPKGAVVAEYKLTYYRSPGGIRKISKIPKEQWSQTLLAGKILIK